MDALRQLHDRLQGGDARCIREQIERADAASSIGTAIAAAQTCLGEGLSGCAGARERLRFMAASWSEALRVPLTGALPCAWAFAEGVPGFLAAVTNTYSCQVPADTAHACLTAYWDVFSPHVLRWLRQLDTSNTPHGSGITSSNVHGDRTVSIPLPQVYLLFHLLLVVCAGVPSQHEAQAICAALAAATCAHGALQWDAQLSAFATAATEQPTRLQHELASLLTGEAHAAAKAPVLQLVCRWAGAQDALLCSIAHSCIAHLTATAACVTGSNVQAVSEPVAARPDDIHTNSRHAGAQRVVRAVTAAAERVAADVQSGAALPHVCMLLVAAGSAATPDQLQPLLAQLCSGLLASTSDVLDTQLTQAGTSCTQEVGAADSSSTGSKYVQMLLAACSAAVLHGEHAVGQALQVVVDAVKHQVSASAMSLCAEIRFTAPVCLPVHHSQHMRTQRAAQSSSMRYAPLLTCCCNPSNLC